jgi:UDP-N-acetyl-D-galactosamine dehydrogenase
MSDKFKIGVIGLGYVGLPLAVEFSKHFQVTGFDLDETRVSELKKNIDNTREVSEQDLKKAHKSLNFSNKINDIQDINFYVVCVPTPIDHDNVPDMRSLKSASSTVGSVLEKGNFVVYESTVYPGATKEICIPILSKQSSLVINKDFYVGYSPERINPGDHKHRINQIIKITSGSNSYAAKKIDKVYKKIISAGTYMASSIEVAEAAKVIENTQRDLNISLVNELSLIFNRLDIDTKEVIDAAATKWNFSPFYPGLVGGHCIGVDPYYLTYKSQLIGYDPKVILSGRKLNDSMPRHVASLLLQSLKDKKIKYKNARVLILGFSFKENCPDIRNSKVEHVVSALRSKVKLIDVHDPVINLKQAKKEFPDVSFVKKPKQNSYDALIIAVSHQEFLLQGDYIKKLAKTQSIIFDLKSIFPIDFSDIRL